MDDAVSVRDLNFGYAEEKWIIRGYSSGIEKESVFAILGPNGRGKTTLLKLILGVLKPSSGSISVNGHIAFVPQLFNTTFAYTALDMVLMGRTRRISLFSMLSKTDKISAMEALDRFGLAEKSESYFHELSGGERQLVMLARALVAEADIVVMDEPTSALDMKNQSLVLQWIRRLSREERLTVIFTTHHPHHALAVADRVMLMMGSSEFRCGESHEILTESNLYSLYGVPMKYLTFEYCGIRSETFAPVLL